MRPLRARLMGGVWGVSRSRGGGQEYSNIRQRTSAYVSSIRQHTWGVSRSRGGGQEFQQSAGLNQGNIERFTF